MNYQNGRLRELDFLRGLAILLVLFRHRFLFTLTYRIGWIGVDLFFVLSGFLVSGLLFREYLKFGEVKPVNFLIRRGFKIYPIYYLTLLIYLLPMLHRPDFNNHYALGDFLFLQNYIGGWGYSYTASWSLAVEEHFYFGLALLLFLCTKKGLIQLKIDKDFKGVSPFEKFIFSLMLLCLAFRFVDNSLYPYRFRQNWAMTHLRLDSLLAGVLVGYLYYFRNAYFKRLFNKRKYILLPLAILLPLFTLFIHDASQSFFTMTIGFSLLYFSFSILLSYFLLNENISARLDRIFSKMVVNTVAVIGFSSYSIYIIHTFVYNNFDRLDLKNPYLAFILPSLISIFVGYLMTRYLESFFLQVRNKYFPSRIDPNKAKVASGSLVAVPIEAVKLAD